MTEFTFKLGVLLLPGLIAAVLVERLTVHPKWEQFRFAAYSLILGCATYLICQVGLYIFNGLNALRECVVFEPCQLKVWAGMVGPGTPIDPVEVGVACCVAVPVGLLLAAGVQHKWMHRLARRMSVSDKFGDENLFTYFLNSPDTNWLWVRDRKNHVIYEGLKDSLSEAENVCEVVLTDVRVYHAKTQELLYELPGIYLSFVPGEFEVEMANLEGPKDD